MAKDHSIKVTSPREGKMVYIGSDCRDISWKSEDGTIQKATIQTGYEIIERTVDRYGQFLFPADLEINTWWTNTGLSDEEVIKNYHVHGETIS